MNSIREVMLIVHFIGLAMGIGISITFVILGIVSSKRGKLRTNIYSIHWQLFHYGIKKRRHSNQKIKSHS